MPKLSSEIKKLLPLDSELKLDTLFTIFEERGTKIDSNIDARILPLLTATNLKLSYCRRSGRVLSDIDMSNIQSIIINNEAINRKNKMLKEARKSYQVLTSREKKIDDSAIHRVGLEVNDPLMNSLEKQKLYEQRRNASKYDTYEYGLSDW